MSRAIIISAFPRLRHTRFYVTSPETQDYNCIAWAADDNSHWWWPTGFCYWPKGVNRTLEVASFKAAYATLGYVDCDNGNAEKGVEKVAIFANVHGRVEHAARQLPSGDWTSKLGEGEDIRHTIFGLEGASYGNVVCYMSRKSK